MDNHIFIFQFAGTTGLSREELGCLRGPQIAMKLKYNSKELCDAIDEAAASVAFYYQNDSHADATDGFAEQLVHSLSRTYHITDSSTISNALAVLAAFPQQPPVKKLKAGCGGAGGGIVNGSDVINNISGVMQLLSSVAVDSGGVVTHQSSGVPIVVDCVSGSPAIVPHCDDTDDLSDHGGGSDFSCGNPSGCVDIDGRSDIIPQSSFSALLAMFTQVVPLVTAEPINVAVAVAPRVKPLPQRATQRDRHPFTRDQKDAFIVELGYHLDNMVCDSVHPIL